jgi:ribose transport system substrate-binding protein
MGQNNHKNIFQNFKSVSVLVGMVAIFVVALFSPVYGGDTNTDLDAMVAKAMAPATWDGPKTAPPPAKDKFVISIPCMQAAVGCARPSDGFLEAAETLGWKTQMIDPAGDPAKLQAALKQAISLKADGIFCAGTTIEQVANVLPLVKKAGIKIVTQSGNLNVPGPDSWDATCNIDYSHRTPALAAWVAKDSGGKANILMVNNSEFDDVNNGYKVFIKELTKICPDCKIVDQIDYSIVDVATTMPQRVKAALLAHPETNYVYGPYDFGVTFINQAIVQSGLKGKVKSVGCDGNPQNLQAIKDGIQGASAAISFEWNGWAAADQLNRLFNGQPRWDINQPEGSKQWYGNENVGIRLFDKTNVPENTDEFWSGDVDFRAKYKEIWGIK